MHEQLSIQGVFRDPFTGGIADEVIYVIGWCVVGHDACAHATSWAVIKGAHLLMQTLVMNSRTKTLLCAVSFHHRAAAVTKGCRTTRAVCYNGGPVLKTLHHHHWPKNALLCHFGVPMKLKLIKPEPPWLPPLPEIFKTVALLHNCAFVQVHLR